MTNYEAVPCEDCDCCMVDANGHDDCDGCPCLNDDDDAQDTYREYDWADGVMQP